MKHVQSWQKRHQSDGIDIFLVSIFFNLEHVSHTVVVFLLLTLSMYLFAGFGIVIFQSIFWLAFLDFIYLKNCFSRNILTMRSTQTPGFESGFESFITHNLLSSISLFQLWAWNNYTSLCGINIRCRPPNGATLFETKYSRMDQVEFVEGRL